MKILIINGPNLNLLGRREPDLYGNISFEEYLEKLRIEFTGTAIDYFQSNIEGEIIDRLQLADCNYDAVILNAGGYTHTSVAIGDTVSAISIPVVEVHITSILKREEYRRVSLIGCRARGSIMGFGLDSYRLGILSVLK